MVSVNCYKHGGSGVMSCDENITYVVGIYTYENWHRIESLNCIIMTVSVV
jgi:hypothetical protein